MAMLTLDDLPTDSLHGKRALVRVDFNVPLDEEGTVIDDTRIRQALPTIRHLQSAGAKVVLVSHCGRPKGEPNPVYSLRPVAEHLSTLLEAPVAFAVDAIGEVARETVDSLAPGDVALLENLRFHPGEKANDAAFVDALAALADVYVNDAFGTAHRAHASVVGVAERIARRAAGRLLVREVEVLSGLLQAPQSPFVGILGGAKISGKIETLQNLLPRLDVLLVGGGMANTFLAARGHGLGRSLVEQDRVAMAGEILADAQKHGVRVLLPTDLVVTDDLADPGVVETVVVETPSADAPTVAEDRLAVDIGPATREAFAAVCAEAAMLFWNGPLGVFERPPFDAGTEAVAASLVDCPGFVVIGGGETVAAVARAGVVESLGHVSTGGGASLALLAGKTLPGVAALEVA